MIKCVSKTIKNEAKRKKGGFLSMLWATLGASLLGNLLTSKGIKTDQARILVENYLNHLITQKEPKLDGVYWRYNLPEIKDGAYVKYLDEYKSIGTHWIALYVNGNNRSCNAINFDSFRVKHIQKEIKEFIRCKNIIMNIYRIQACDSIICGYFCIGFIDFMLKGKILLDYKNLFFPNDYDKNDKIILK